MPSIVLVWMQKLFRFVQNIIARQYDIVAVDVCEQLPLSFNPKVHLN